MRIKKVILILPFLLTLFLAVDLAGARGAEHLPKLIVFTSPSCKSCMKIKAEVMPKVKQEFGDSIQIEYRDISKIHDYKLLIALKEKYNKPLKATVPLFFMRGRFLEGREAIERDFVRFIPESLAAPYGEEGLPRVDLVKRFVLFSPLAVTGAGLIDGINPCAFTVIVFFISFLALQGYRKRELIAIGLSFISAVFLTYLLIGLGLFNFLYRLEGFWLAAQIINISIGIFAVILGVLSLFDFFKVRRTGETEGLFLQLPQSVKNRIHSVIGTHYRRSAQEKQGALRPHLFKLIASALITGFLVSLLEALCTGQVYLPTITFILKTAPQKLQAITYLLLYNIMFIMPLFLVFFFALFGVSSEEFAGFAKKHLALTKFLMAFLFFALGVFLIWNFSV